MIGLFLAITLGMAYGMLAEALDNSVRTTRDVRKILDMPPIAAIPEIRIPSEVRRIRNQNLAYALCVAVLVAAVAVYVGIQSSTFA